VNSFIGVCENIFSLEKGLSQHEINIVFIVEVTDKTKTSSKENHIEFVSIAKGDLKNCKILPAPLKDGLIEWLENGRPFWKEIRN